jgi:hypothetical protein
VLRNTPAPACHPPARAQAGLEPRRMLHDFGHHAVAKQLFDGSDSFDGFVAFAEAVTGQDFVVFVRAIMPRTIMEIVMQVGDAVLGVAGGVGACPT